MADLHAQLSRAVAVLQQLEQKDEEELIPEDPNLTLVFQLWEHYHATSPFPIAIDVRHPLYAESVLPVRVITKDPHEEWKERFKSAMPPFSLKSYSISKWRRRFGTAGERRRLIAETRIFVADSRIGHLLGDCLGADFFQKKRVPVLVDLAGDDIVEPIFAVLGCTTAVLPKADKFAVAVGRVSWSAEEIADNACDVVDAVFEKIGRETVAAIALRAPRSVALPVFTADIAQIVRDDA
jgi:ribosome biogenesis protein UTP30